MATIDRRGATISATDPAVPAGPNPDLAIKTPVRLATTGSNVAASGLLVVDGVQTVAGDRVLVKDQTNPKTNGIYDVATGNWTRSIDANNNSQWTTGALVEVTSGTANAGRFYELSSAAPIVLGTTAMTFALLAIASGNFVGDTGTGGAPGLVPAPPAGSAAAGKFLSAAGDFEVPAGSTGIANIIDFGALGTTTDGSDGHDDTAAIQAAITTGKTVYIPNGKWRVTAALTVGTNGQLIYGDGKNRSTLMVAAVFASGVIVCSTGDPGPCLRDFGIAFKQPDTAVRANLTAYPAAVNAQNTARFMAQRLLIQRAMVGIDLTGTSGASTIEYLECSAFTASVKIDGAADTMRLDELEINNWGCTGNQTAILQNSATLGLSIGRCDDLKLSNSLILAGTCVSCFAGAGGSVSGEITNTGFDTLNGLVMTSGFLLIASSYFSLQTSTQQAIVQSGGDLTLAACRLLDVGGAGVGNTAISISNGAAFTWAGGTAFLASQDRALVKSFNAGTVINLTALTIFRNANVAYTIPTLWKTAGTANISNCSMGNGVGSGSGVFIEIDTDDYDVVSGNAANNGWTYSFPASPTKGVYPLNGGGSPLSLKLGGTAADLSATGGAGQYVKQASAGGAFTVGTIPASDVASGQALTQGNDTNVTLTLGGTPSTALLKAASITAGWAGTLALSRGGTAANLSATGGASQVLKQTSVGGAVTVAQLAASDLSNGTTGSGAVALATSPSFTTPSLGAATATTLQLGSVAPSGNNIIELSIGSATGRFIDVQNTNAEAQYGVDAGGGVYAWLVSGTSTIFGTQAAVNVDFFANNIKVLSLVQGAALINEQVYVRATQASTSTTTGGLRVDGGAGIAGAIYLGGKLGCASFVVASLPSGSNAGETVYASNCRVFNGAGTQEGAGVGTGGLVNYNGTAWKIAGTNVTAVA